MLWRCCSQPKYITKRRERISKRNGWGRLPRHLSSENNSKTRSATLALQCPRVSRIVFWLGPRVSRRFRLQVFTGLRCVFTAWSSWPWRILVGMHTRAASTPIESKMSNIQCFSMTLYEIHKIYTTQIEIVANSKNSKIFVGVWSLFLIESSTFEFRRIQISHFSLY